MRDSRLEVSVSFDERRGYVAHANGLPTITALSRADASMSGSYAGLLFKLAAAASSAALMAAITASSAGWPLRCAATDRRK